MWGCVQRLRRRVFFRLAGQKAVGALVLVVVRLLEQRQPNCLFRGKDDFFIRNDPDLIIAFANVRVDLRCCEDDRTAVA